MTDNDIIEALELCASNKIGRCTNCHYFFRRNCTRHLMIDAHKITVRQKMRIEKLRKKLNRQEEKHR